MTRRQLGFVFGALAGLSAAWFAVRGADRSADNGDGRLDVAARISSGVSVVRVLAPDSTDLRLELDEGGWIVNGYPAADSLMETVLTRLASLPPARLVARNPANHDRLGVSSESARRVEMGRANGPSLVFLLGSAGPEGRFIRLPDRPEVYVVSAAAVRDLDRNEAQWRDPTITEVDTAALTRIVVTRGANPAFEIRRGAEGGWRTGDAPADTMVVRIFLERVANLKALGFPADSFVFAVDFDRPDATLDLYVGTSPMDPPAVSLLFGSAENRSEVLVRRADDPIAYAIDAATANLLTAGPSRWRGLPSR